MICFVVLLTPLLAQEPKTWTTAEDHQQMMAQLGIRALRPGPSGNESAPNQANYDESKANPFPILPDALTLKNGTKVTTAAVWWKQRRPEIVEDFEREVRRAHSARRARRAVDRGQSRARNAWRARGDRQAACGTRHERRASGAERQHSDDARHAGRRERSRSRDDHVRRRRASAGARRTCARAPRRWASARARSAGDPPATEQLIAAGWGFASISPASIQADNGAGLTRGIIGLVNKGQPRKPDDWGSLRAWAWGASRALDYLETDPSIDAKRVGIEGVSRYGKAALVTMAFDQRFAVVLVGSSGEGGAKLHRRNWGEQVENLTGAGEYHWMAGNFLKYGAAEADFGSKNAGDIPVDAHQLIALCAPRPTFISYGVPERGDAKWLDHQGSYMAAVAAGPVFRLLGAKDLGTIRRLPIGKDAGSERQHARRPARVAAARRRSHRRPELEVFHSVGDDSRRSRPHARATARVAGEAMTWRRSQRR